MENHTKVIDAFKVIGLEIQTNSKASEVEIGALWHKFIAENFTDQIPNKAHIYPIALYYNYGSKNMCCPQGADAYACLIGCKVTNLDTIPVGMVGKAVPEQRYALFRATGDFPEGLIKTWQAINAAGLERTYEYDIESYEHFQQPDHEVDIYVAIK